MSGRRSWLLLLRYSYPNPAFCRGLGIHSGEISQNKARSRYGKWFDDAVKRGRLRPCRVDDGIRGTKHFRVVDIQELKTKDLVRAELQFKTNN